MILIYSQYKMTACLTKHKIKNKQTNKNKKELANVPKTALTNSVLKDINTLNLKTPTYDREIEWKKERDERKREREKERKNIVEKQENYK